MKYIIVESFRRLIQMFFGMEIFDFPVLMSVRGFLYKSIYTIGRKPTICHGVRFSKSHRQLKGSLSVGNGVTFGKNVEIDYTGEVVIENNVIISSGAKVFSHSHPVFVGWTENGEGIPELHKVVIEDNVWIGANAIILPQAGIIGKNAVIGAGAVVTKSVAPNVIVAGNPARVIGEVPNV